MFFISVIPCDNEFRRLIARGMKGHFLWRVFNLGELVLLSAPSYGTGRSRGCSMIRKIVNRLKVDPLPGCKERMAGAVCELHPEYVGSTEGQRRVGRAGSELPGSSPCSAHGGGLAGSC